MKKTHGLSKTKFHDTYYSIRDRCEKPHNTSYPRYGGRGIKCYWTAFEEFMDDMYASYLLHVKEHGERNTTIDRINPKKGYFKENCRWATHAQQSTNRSNNVLVTINSKTATVSEWAKEKNLSPFVIYNRINKLKWGLEEAITTPLGGRAKKISFRGKTQTIAQWAKQTGVSATALNNRLFRYNWSLKRALTT